MPTRYDDLPKALKREIRDLAGVVHERLLTRELGKLEAEFARWRLGELDAFELSALIHKFHEGPPRKLWLMFNTNHISTLACHVAEGLDDGLLPGNEISQELHEFLRTVPRL
jgi:hypothetical protein